MCSSVLFYLLKGVLSAKKRNIIVTNLVPLGFEAKHLQKCCFDGIANYFDVVFFLSENQVKGSSIVVQRRIVRNCMSNDLDLLKYSEFSSTQTDQIALESKNVALSLQLIGIAILMASLSILIDSASLWK